MKRRGLAAALALAMVAAACEGEGDQDGTTTSTGAGAASDGGGSATSSSSATGGAGGTGGAGVREALEARMQDAAADGFSGVVAVSRGDELLLANGYGTCIRETDTPCTVDTVFDIGSVTKQFTAAAILSLVDSETLQLDDTLSTFFPAAPADKADITIHQLLTHTAGMPDVLGDDYEPIDRQAFLDLVFATPLTATPGTVHAYSNVGYSLLGIILETTTSSSYEEALRSRLFDEAGMTRTGYVSPEWSELVVAHGYESGAPFGSPLDHAWDTDGPYWHLRANGGLLSTAPDMMLWDKALAGSVVLSDAAKNAVFTPHVEEEPGGDTFYGYGWVVEDTPHGKLVWHNGGNGSFFADFWRYLDAGVTVFCASNAYDAYAGNDDLARALAAIVLDADR